MTAAIDAELRAAAVQAATNWAPMYPIPAWGLAEGDGAEKLAANWARVVAGMVLDAVSPMLAAEVEQARTAERKRIAAYIERVAASGLRPSPPGMDDGGASRAWAQVAEWCRDDSIWNSPPEPS